MPKQTPLKIVGAQAEGASIILPGLGAHQPVFDGGPDDEDLVCGKCGAVIAKGFSVATFGSRFAAPVQLLTKCPTCGVHYNVLPASIGKV